MALRAEDPEPHAVVPGDDGERQRAGALRVHLPTGAAAAAVVGWQPRRPRSVCTLVADTLTT